MEGSEWRTLKEGRLSWKADIPIATGVRVDRSGCGSNERCSAVSAAVCPVPQRCLFGAVQRRRFKHMHPYGARARVRF